MKFPENPIINTERLILRLLDLEDLPALFAVDGDEEVVRYTPRTAWKTPADAEAWFDRVLANHEKGEALQFVIVLRESVRPIGTISLFHFNEPVGSGEVGYSLAREFWGKGLTKEALAAFVNFGFDTMGLQRLEAELDPRNVASARVLEHAGFRFEGLQRRNYFAKGELSDTALYGMLREDPRRNSPASIIPIS
jgi:ribosomal-protein-alanine N-acetyltransferase